MTAMMTPYGDLRLHEVLHAARRRKGLSQKALAAAVGVSQGTVSKWESDKHALLPDLYELRRFIEITGAEELYDLRILPSV